MFYIKKSSSESGRFKPHYNRSTGKYYGSSKDYVSDLKKSGLEPYNPNSVKQHKEHKYEASKWTKDVARAIENNGGKTPGHAKEIIKQHMGNVKQAPSNIVGETKGGIKGDK